MDNRKIGEFIANARKQKNMTQRELADLLGITDKAISKWERGMGYPDISLLTPLADALSISVTELLEGESRTALSVNETAVLMPASITESSISQEVINSEEASTRRFLDVLSYADSLRTHKEIKVGKLLAVSLSVLIIIATFTCVIVELAVSQRLSWSLIVISSCMMGGCLMIPLFLSRKQGSFYSLCLLTVLILPFLWSIYQLTAPASLTTAVLWQMEYPIAVLWLVFLWITYLLIKTNKLSGFVKAGTIVLLCIPFDLYTNYLIDHFLGQDTPRIDALIDVAYVFLSIIISAFLFLMAFLRRRKSE